MNTRLARILRLATVPAVSAVALAGSLGVSHAQTPPPGAQPIAPAIVTNPGGPGTAPVQIFTDRSFYYVGQPIEYCITVPYPGYVTIYDRQPGQPEKVVNSLYEWNSYDCFWGTVTPPTGHETLRLVFSSSGQFYSDQTSFWTQF